MALNLAVGTLTQPGSTGNQTVNLASNFDPKALIVWATPQTTDGGVNANASFAMGMATYRGAAVQHGYCSYFTQHAAASAVVARGTNTDALLKLYSNGTTPTVDLEIDFVSFATGGSSNFVINWVNLHTTASILVHYMVLGGSDITDAYVHNFALSTAAATQDVSLPSGFGVANLVMWMASAATALGDSATHCALMFGAAKSSTERFCSTFNDEDAAGTMLCAGWNKERAILILNPSTQAADAEADLDVVSSWPTDGYRLAYADQATLGVQMIGLALKGTFSSTVGFADSPTSTGDVDFSHGSVPKGALVFSAQGPGTAATINTNGSILGAFGMGALDGSSEAWAGAGNADAAANSDTAMYFQTDKVVTYHNPTSAAMLAEADGSISGNNIRFGWTTVHSSAHRAGVMSLGDALIAAPPPSAHLSKIRHLIGR